MKRYFIIYLLLTVYGCANGYSQFYKSYIPSEKSYIDCNSIIIYTSSNILKDVEHLLEKNYIILGESNFFGEYGSESQARSHACNIGAEIILLKIDYVDAQSFNVPLILPNTTTSTTNFNAYTPQGNIYGNSYTTTHGTSTSYVPLIIHRYKHAAVFFKKSSQRYIFGAKVRNLNQEEKYTYETNMGVAIVLVLEDSQAFNTNFLRGDIILEINNERIAGGKHFIELLQIYSGQEVEIKFIRKGVYQQQKVQLDPLL
jgi:hypothetical protein